MRDRLIAYLVLAISLIAMWVGFAWAADYITTVAADNPVGFWYFDEASGTTSTNHGSSSGNDFTYVGSPTLGASGAVPGHTAVTLNGSSQVVEHHGASAVGSIWDFSATDMTWECLVNFTGGAAYFSSRVYSEGASCGSNLVYLWEFSGLPVTMNLHNTTQCGGSYISKAGTTSSITTGVWYQVAAKYNHTSPRIDVYFNGANEGNSTSTSGSIQTGVDNDGTYMRYGSSTTSSGAFQSSMMNGKMQMCSVFNTALSDARILAHYNAISVVAATGEGLPFSVKRERLEPYRFGFDRPVVHVNLPGFMVDRLNRRFVSVSGAYGPTW